MGMPAALRLLCRDGDVGLGRSVCRDLGLGKENGSESEVGGSEVPLVNIN